MKNMNGGLRKQINMHVGEVIHRLGEHPCETIHACDSNEIDMKIETELGKASIHVNGNKRSKESRK